MSPLMLCARRCEQLKIKTVKKGLTIHMKIRILQQKILTLLKTFNYEKYIYKKFSFNRSDF